MRKLFLSGTVALMSCLAGALPAQAGCTGAVGSTDLSCTSNNGTLADYVTWIETTYLAQAVQSLMQSFAAVYSPVTSNGTGYGQVYDNWNVNAHDTSKTVAYGLTVSPWYVSSTTTTTKTGDEFYVDGVTSSINGANVYLELNWTGTVARVIDGVTNYIASYSYTITGAAWAAGMANATVNKSGSGEYNLTAVPGPVAAAGLPALLAFGAYAAYRRRRRN